MKKTGSLEFLRGFSAEVGPKKKALSQRPRNGRPQLKLPRREKKGIAPQFNVKKGNGGDLFSQLIGLTAVRNSYPLPFWRPAFASETGVLSDRNNGSLYVICRGMDTIAPAALRPPWEKLRRRKFLIPPFWFLVWMTSRGGGPECGRGCIFRGRRFRSD